MRAKKKNVIIISSIEGCFIDGHFYTNVKLAEVFDDKAKH